MSNFREVFVEVVRERRQAENNPQHERMLHRACGTTEHSHPRFWLMLEHHVAHRYERIEGEPLGLNIDWAGLKQWLKDHWPQIVSMICSIIGLFLLFAHVSDEAEETEYRRLFPDFQPTLEKAQEVMQNANELITDVRGKLDDVWGRLFGATPPKNP